MFIKKGVVGFQLSDMFKTLKIQRVRMIQYFTKNNKVRSVLKRITHL